MLTPGIADAFRELGDTGRATPPRPKPLGAAEAKALDSRLGDIADPELRAALSGLGRLVLGQDRDG